MCVIDVLLIHFRLSVDRALSVLTSGHMLSRNDSVLKAKVHKTVSEWLHVTGVSCFFFL